MARRTLRIETCEPRLLLAHDAPQLNPALLAHFYGIQQNQPIATNGGEDVENLLVSGGTVLYYQYELPLASNFAFFDYGNNAKLGIAVTGLSGAADGAWQYELGNAQTWTDMPGNVSTANALLLSFSSAEEDSVRFLPNAGFSGQVHLQFACWDQTDGKTPGSLVNLSTTGTGGSTAYSSAVTDAVLTVGPNTPPMFNIADAAGTVDENNNGSNAGTITLPNVVSDVLPGNGGGNAVTFSAVDPSGDVLNPTIGGDGSLSFKLAQGAVGTVTVTVTASNGSLASNGYTHVTINQTTPPSFTATNEQVVENSGAASYSNWATNVSPGVNGGDVGSLTYSITSDNDPGLFASAPTFVGGGNTLTFTPAAGQIGQAQLTATVYDPATRLSSPVLFTIGVYGAPTATPKSYVIDYAAGGSASSAASGVRANDTDPNSGFDGGLTARLVSGPAFANSFSLSPNGTFSFAPNSSFSGFTRFEYQVASGPATSAVQPATLYSHEGAMVVNVYNDVLIRGPADSDIESWAPQLHSASLSMGGFAADMVTSTEHLNTVVTSIFEALLGHAPSADQESNWVAQWRNGGGPSNVWLGIATTAECFNYAQTKYNFGDANQNWVALIYQALLNRAASSSDRSYFAAQLESQPPQTTLQQVVNALLTSQEYYDLVINQYYNQYLDRAPSSSDKTYWEGQLRGGVSQLAFQELLIGSAEYATHPPAATGGNADLWPS